MNAPFWLRLALDLLATAGVAYVTYGFFENWRAKAPFMPTTTAEFWRNLAATLIISAFLFVSLGAIWL